MSLDTNQYEEVKSCSLLKWILSLAPVRCLWRHGDTVRTFVDGIYIKCSQFSKMTFNQASLNNPKLITLYIQTKTYKQENQKNLMFVLLKWLEVIIMLLLKLSRFYSKGIFFLILRAWYCVVFKQKVICTLNSTLFTVCCISQI